MSTYLAREREKEGETGGENAGEERGTLLTKFQGVSRHFNVFLLPEDCARRDAHTVYRALPNFYCGRKWIFTLCRESFGSPQPIFRDLFGSLGWAELFEPNSSRNWPSERVHSSRIPVYILCRREEDFSRASHLQMTQIYHKDTLISW